jgi:UDP-N-acetylglucosamine diphosphorylase/glucosamine-1-phosphate N-acetyltransferase
MQAVILAAGKGIRTYPLTLTRPKPLLTFANKSILEHDLEQLQGLVNEAIIVIGYKGEMIKERIGNSFGNIKITYVEQKEQLGPGHALMQAKKLIAGRFIVINGDDIYSREDLKRCLSRHYCVQAQKVKDPENWGIFELDKDGFVKRIVERPKEKISDLGNTGVYVFDKKIFDFDLEKTERNEYEITDYVTELAKHNDVYCEMVRDYWFAVRYPWDLLDINKFFVDKIRKKIKGKIEKGTKIHGNLMLGKGSVILSGTYIEGNVIIGENCKIGPNCYIRGSTSIGDGCRIGQAVEVKNIILMKGSKIPHLSYIGDSVIGEKVNLGAGTITGNLRHDNADIKSMIKEELVNSGRRKFGTIIGDDVHTGIHTSIYPGRKIWAGKTTAPGEVVKKDITD